MRRSAIFLAAAVLTMGLQPQQALHAQGGARVSGAGISKIDRDTRKLTANAQAQLGSNAATGSVQFIHHSPVGLSRFRGSINCLSVSGATVQISGNIDKGETATGALLDGKAYSFTISTGNPQSFSLPSIGDAGSIAACSGGRGETVEVTEEGFTTR